MPSRRPHSKSRHGCTSCKKAHIKCNQAQPKCAHCERTGKTCEYQLFRMQPSSTPAQNQIPSAQPSPTSNTASPGPDLHGSPHIPISSPATSIGSTYNHNEFTFDDIVYMHHYCTETSKYMSKDEIAWQLWKEEVPKLARSQPCLMHVILAFAALHFSILEPEKSQLHRHAAEKHQHIGLALVRPLMSNMKENNCNGIWAYSILQAVCTLANYSKIDPSMTDKIDDILNILSLTRGISIILSAGYDHVGQNVLAPLVYKGVVPDVARGLPSHVEEVVGDLEILISKEEDLESRDTYRDTLLVLKRTYYGSLIAKQEEAAFIANMHHSPPMSKFVLAWCAMVRAHYCELVADRKPIALILLMYMALLFHPVRQLWWVGSWALHLIQATENALPLEYRNWSEFLYIMCDCEGELWSKKVFEEKKRERVDKMRE